MFIISTRIRIYVTRAAATYLVFMAIKKLNKKVTSEIKLKIARLHKTKVPNIIPGKNYASLVRKSL